MAQQTPERICIAEILKLVNQLSADEQDQLLEEMKDQWLRREIQKGIDQADLTSEPSGIFCAKAKSKFAGLSKTPNRR